MKLDFCAVCGSKEDLHQHHIVPVILSGIKRITADDDGTITLCGYHHAIAHEKKVKGDYNHKRLTKEGLKKARESGIKLGRPVKTTRKEKSEILRLLEMGQSVTSISKLYKISRASVVSIRKQSISGELKPHYVLSAS